MYIATFYPHSCAKQNICNVVQRKGTCFCVWLYSGIFKTCKFLQLNFMWTWNLHGFKDNLIIAYVHNRLWTLFSVCPIVRDQGLLVHWLLIARMFFLIIFLLRTKLIFEKWPNAVCNNFLCTQIIFASLSEIFLLDSTGACYFYYPISY